MKRKKKLSNSQSKQTYFDVFALGQRMNTKLCNKNKLNNLQKLFNSITTYKNNAFRDSD